MSKICSVCTFIHTSHGGIPLHMALVHPKQMVNRSEKLFFLKGVKNYRESTPKSKIAKNGLVLLYIESDLLNNILYDDIIDDFDYLKSLSKNLPNFIT